MRVELKTQQVLSFFWSLNFVVLRIVAVLWLPAPSSAQTSENCPVYPTDNSLIFDFSQCKVKDGLLRGLVIVANGGLKSKLALEVDKINNFTPGFYDILTDVEYSGDSQSNESFYLEVVDGDGTHRGPCDSTNVENKLVVIPDIPVGGTQVLVESIHAGRFYLYPGSKIYFKHYKILVDSLNVRKYVMNCPLNTPPGDCFDVDSIHLFKMRLEKSADQSSKISLTKNADKKTVQTGDTVKYTLTLKNVSFDNDTVRTIILRDVLPDSIILDESTISPRPEDIDNKTIIWERDSLAPNVATVFSYQVKVIQTQLRPLLENRSEVKSSCGSATDSFIVEVVGDSTDVKLMKSVRPDTVIRGQPFTFSLFINNVGMHTAKDVVVEDILPDSVEFIGFVSDALGSPDPNNNGRIPVNIGDLAARDSVLLEFQCVYPKSLELPKSPFERVNIACVSATNDSNATNDCDTVSVFILDIDNPDPPCDCIVLDRNVFEPERVDPVLGQNLNISFKLGVPGLVKMKVLDITGYLVTTLTEQEYPAGEHTIKWRGTTENEQKVGSGVYIIYFWFNNCDCLEKVILAR